MALCTHCHKRKAKRRCPALRGDLCPLCCGMLREKALRCPPDCPHLARHRPYQEKKVTEKRVAQGVDVRQDERLNWLAVNLEAALLGIARDRPDFTDRDAVLALEYALEKVEKGRTSLLILEGASAPKNEAGESLLEVVERTRFEGTIIVALSPQVYTKEEKTACLESLVAAVKHWAATDLAGRAYLSELGRRYARPQSGSPSGRIISPR